VRFRKGRQTASVRNGEHHAIPPPCRQDQRIEPSCVAGPSRNYCADLRSIANGRRGAAPDWPAAGESEDPHRLRRATRRAARLPLTPCDPPLPRTRGAIWDETAREIRSPASSGVGCL
jgi:hypothetical protein